MTDAPLREGPLTKRGGGFPYKWQSRKFKLHAHCLEYFSGDELKGTFNITHESTCTTTDDKPFSFSLVTGSDSLRMHSASAQDTEEWMQAILHVIEYCTAVAEGAELEYATKDLESPEDLEEGEDDGYDGDNAGAGDADADADAGAGAGDADADSASDDKSVEEEEQASEEEEEEEDDSDQNSFDEDSSLDDDDDMYGLYGMGDDDSIDEEDEDAVEARAQRRLEKQTRALSRLKPKTTLSGSYSKILEVVANVSSKPKVGTYCAYFDESDDVYVRNDVYNGSGDEYCFDFGNLRMDGIEDPQSLLYSGDLAPACVALYENNSSIVVLIGCHCNAVIAWTVWSRSQGWRDDSSAVLITLPPPLSGKDMKAAEAVDAAAKAKKLGQALPVAIKDDPVDDEDIEVPSVYSVQPLHYSVNGDVEQRDDFGICVCGRSDGFVTYINFTADSPDVDSKILFHTRIHGSGINVVGLALPAPQSDTESAGAPRRRASLTEKDKSVSFGNTRSVYANKSDEKAYVFAGLFNGEIVRWLFSLAHLDGKAGMTRLTRAAKSVPLLGRLEMTDHTDSVTSFTFLENAYDDCIEVAEERNRLWCVFSGSDDFSVDMWHVETGSLLRSFEGHEEGLTAVALYSPTSNILDSVLVTGSYDGMLKMWSVSQGTEISSNDVGYLDSIAIVSGSTYLAPDVQPDEEAGAVVSKAAAAQKALSLMFYVAAEDVQVRVMATGCTTLDNQLFLPTTSITNGHHHHRSATTRSMCCAENFSGQHVLLMTTGDDVRAVYSMDSHMVDDEDFNVVTTARELGEILGMQQLVLSDRPKPEGATDPLVHGNVVAVVHSNPKTRSRRSEQEEEQEQEEDEDEDEEEENSYSITVYDICAQSDYEMFACDKVVSIGDGAGNTKLSLSSELFHLFELNNKPFICFLQNEERTGKNDKTVTVVLTKIYDICGDRCVEDEFVMTQPAPEANTSGVTDVKVMVNDEDSTFCVFISTTDKTGSIYVQPFGLKTGAIAVKAAAKAEYSMRATMAVDARQSLTADGKPAKKAVEKKAKRMVGHQKKVTKLYTHYATKPGMSDYIVSASEDKTVRLWNPKTFQLVHVLTGHKKDICSISSLPHPADGTVQEFIVSADVSGNINIWDCESGDLKRKLIDSACDDINLCWINPKKLFSAGDDEDLAEVQIEYMLVSSGASSLSFWKLFEDGLPSRSELTKAFNSDRAAAKTKKSTERAIVVAGAEDAEMAATDESSMKKAKVIPFTSVQLCISGCKDARALLAHCGSQLFRVAVNADLWCFVDDFLPLCPDVLLYEATYRKKVKVRRVGDKSVKTVQYYTLLEDAMIQQRLKSVTVLLAAWTAILSTAPDDMLAQIVFPFNALKKSELYYLASNYPKEFMDFIVGLKPLRAHELSLGDASSFPLGDSKFYIHGTQSRVPFDFNPAKGSYFPHWLKIKKERKDEDPDDEVADQVVSAFFIPLKFAAAPELLLTYVDVCDDLGGDKSLFGSPVVVFAVRYAWKIYGRKLHLRSLQIYLLFVIVFMAGTFVYGFHIQNHINGSFWKGVNVILQLATIVMNSYFLFMEGVQMLNADASMLEKYDRMNLAKAEAKGTKISTTMLGKVLSYFDIVELWHREIPGIIEYFSDFWNQIDITMIICIYISSVSHIVSYEEHDVARCVLAVANILVWSKIMYFARSHSQGGPLIAMIVQIASDMKPFLMVLATILFGYAFSFWIMTYGTADNAFNTIDGTLINSFSFMLGGFDPGAFAGIEVEGFAQFLSVIFMLIVSLLLLNLLIAIMGNSYGIVQERTKQQYRWEQASSIVDQLNLVLFPPSDSENLRMNPIMIHFVARDSTFAKGSDDYCDIDGTDAAENEDPVVTQKEFSGQLSNLENRVLKHENSKFNEVNDKIATLESKIDSLVGLMKDMSAVGAADGADRGKKKKSFF